AMTMLDQNRAYAQIALKAGVGVDQVGRLAIWGNHSTTQYPDFYQATVSGKPALSIIKDEAWFQTVFLDIVQKRGAEIIKARGASSAGSAANAVVDTVRNIVSPTPKGAIFSVAVCSDGSYGIDKGLIFSYPIRSDGKKWEIVQKFQHNAFSLEKIKATHEELKQERDAVRGLLKIGLFLNLIC